MKFYFFIFIFLFFLVGTFLVLAQEAPQYNFASMQADEGFSLKPGQEVSTKLYFYNIYGNRPTHIRLSIRDEPDNWNVEIIPGIETRSYDVSGEKVSVEENLVIYPSNATEQPGTEETEKDWISSKVGYINANFVTIKIKVPDNEKIGVTKSIKINAVAFWLGQTGTIALEQERDFEYEIKTSTEYYEKPYEEGVETETTTLNLGQKIGNLFNSTTQIQPLTMLLTGVTLTLVIVFVILAILFKRNKKEGKKIKK